MAETALSNVIDFFKDLGVYDIVLPFLLTFSILYAILEKTALFGKEKVGDGEYTKKNLNALVSLAVAFLVIGSSKIVETITAVSSKIVILLMLSIFFIMLIGTFFTKKDLDEKGVGLEGGWKITFMFIMFIGTVFIFLDALTVEDGRTWLEVFMDWILRFSTDVSVGAILLMIALVAFIAWIVREKPK